MIANLVFEEYMGAFVQYLNSVCLIDTVYVNSHCLKSTHCVDKSQGGQDGQVISGKLCEHTLPAILDETSL